MNINMNDKNLMIGYLQAFLNENYEKGLAMSNTMDEDTYNKLIEYMTTPEIISGYDFCMKLGSTKFMYTEYLVQEEKEISWYFNIQANQDSVILKSKQSNINKLLDTSKGNFFETIKKVGYESGWSCTISNDDTGKLIVKYAQLKIPNLFPRKDLLPLINLLGKNYLIDYELYHNTYDSNDTGGIREYTPELEYKIIRSSETEESTRFTVTIIYYTVMYNKMNQMENHRGRFTYCVGEDGTVLGWQAPDGIYYSTNELINNFGISITGTIKKGDYFEIVTYRRHKRLYVINNIDLTEYSFFFTHSMPVNILGKIGISDDYISIDEILSGELVLNSILIDDINLDANKMTEISTMSSIDNPRTLFVEVYTEAENRSEDFYYPTNIILGDVNKDNLLTEEDKNYINSRYNRLLMSTYDTQQKYALQVINPTIIYDNIPDAISDSYMTKLNTLINQQRIVNVSIPVYIESSECNFYLGAYNPDILDTYNNVDSNDFRDNPFIVHSKFFDYLLDMAITPYSEDSRIKKINETVFDINQLEYEDQLIYSDDLRKVIFNLQIKNGFTFPDGYVDVKTKAILDRL